MMWYEHPEDNTRGYFLESPYDRIFIGCDPRDGMTKETADSFDCFVNVNDCAGTTFYPSRPGQQMHWYPVNEQGRWNLSYLYWIVKVLDHHYDAGHRIYLHCAAGAYRSPSAALLWLQSRGHSPEQALILDKSTSDGIYRTWKSHDSIPRLRDFMFKMMRERPAWSLGAILCRAPDYWNRECRAGYYGNMHWKRHYFWFYFVPKHWLSDQKRTLRDWLKGLGYWANKEGWARYYYPRRHFWAWSLNAEPKDPSEKVVTNMHWDCDAKVWADNPKEPT